MTYTISEALSQAHLISISNLEGIGTSWMSLGSIMNTYNTNSIMHKIHWDNEASKIHQKPEIIY